MKNFKRTLLALAFFTLFALFILPRQTMAAETVNSDIVSLEALDTISNETVDVAPNEALNTASNEAVDVQDDTSNSEISVLSDSDLSIITLAVYKDWEFTYRSATEPRTLQGECNSISLYATCEGEAVDDLSVTIVGLTDPTIYYTYDFYADGSITTISCSIPAGQYKVTVWGDPNKLKNDVLVTFDYVTPA